MKQRIGQLFGQPGTEVEYPFDYQGQSLMLTVQGGDELQLSVQGSFAQPETCARCGRDTTSKLQLDTIFTAGDEESDWHLVDGMIDTDELAAAAVQLTNPLIIYCNKCSQIKNGRTKETEEQS